MKRYTFYAELYSSLFDRGLLASRDYASFGAFARESADGQDFEMPRELRRKNAYNLLRLIDCATHWLANGRPRFVASEPLRSELLAIKRGTVELAVVLERADELAVGLEEARRTTSLPLKPDVAMADAILTRARLEIARRHLEAARGPFGSGAAPRPVLVSDK